MSLLLVEVFGGKTVEKIDDEQLVSGMTDLFLRGVLPPPMPEPGRQAATPVP
jgi:hypothetical protein